MSAAEPADGRAAEPGIGRAEPTDLLTLEAVEAAAAHIYAHHGYAPDPPAGPARPPARRVEVSIDPAARQLMTALYGPTFADEVEGRLAAALPGLLADTLTEETP